MEVVTESRTAVRGHSELGSPARCGSASGGSEYREEQEFVEGKREQGRCDVSPYSRGDSRRAKARYRRKAEPPVRIRRSARLVSQGWDILRTSLAVPRNTLRYARLRSLQQQGTI